jgi:hypothetical protein
MEKVVLKIMKIYEGTFFFFGNKIEVVVIKLLVIFKILSR